MSVRITDDSSLLVRLANGDSVNVNDVVISPDATIIGGTLYMPGALAIETNALADGDVAMPYTQTAVASGGVAPYSWELLGALPVGLSLIAATGTIVGTPTTEQETAFALRVTDALGASASRSYSVVVHSLSSKYLRLFGQNLILWHKQAEPAGNVAVDSSPTASNGTYANVTVGTSGIGDGNTSAVYTAAPVSSANVLTNALKAKWNGDEITIAVWVKFTDPASWLDANVWELFQYVNTAGTAYLDIIHAGNGWIQTRLGPVAVLNDINRADTDWFQVLVTYSKTAGQAKMYHNGILVSQVACAGFWLGTLDKAVIGNAVAPTAGSAWRGKQAHHLVLNRAVMPLEAQEAHRLQESGIWDVYGTVLEPSNPALADQFVGEPNLKKGPSQILPGNTPVFRLWYSMGDNVNHTAIGYAESRDCKHWVTYAGNPILAGVTRASGPVQFSGVYYMLAQTPAYRLNLYTSPDGVAWTLEQADVLSVVPGVEGGFFNSWLGYDATLAHPWVLIYEYLGADNAHPYRIGLAQADNPAGPWVKSVHNPIIAHPNFGAGVNGIAGGPFAHKSSDGHWHIWCHGGTPVTPTDLFRLDSPALDAVFAQATPGPVLARYNPESLAGGNDSQLADATLLRDGDTTYMMFATVANQNNGIVLALATTPLSLDQIVQTSEGLRPDANPEQLLNPSFEVTKIGGTTFAYWVDTVADGAVARTTIAGEVVPDTSRLAACKLTAGAAMTTHTQQQVTGLIPGRTYSLTAQGRGDGVHAGRVRVQNSANADLIPFGSILTTIATAYAGVACTFVAPPDGVATVGLWCPATAGGFVCFDQLSLVRAVT